ncbi:MAG: PQQ-like beta-propeller repeat protein [Sandaracinaceae bacterium]|nr:PQQ-like beta-propeller repeat protein [Sandaracinaceae bacterium]
MSVLAERVVWLVVWLVAIVARAEAQTPHVVYRRDPVEPPGAVFRLADASAAWVLLERDADAVSQEILVLRASDGTEVRRMPGLVLPTAGMRNVSETFDLTVRPWLSGDRVITFRDPATLTCVAIADGRELWRVAVSTAVLFEGELVASDTRVAWVDGSGLHVIDAGDGHEIFHVAYQPWVSQGRLALAGDGRVAGWDREGFLQVWDASGRALSRVSRGVFYGASYVAWAGSTVLVGGDSLAFVDPSTGALLRDVPHGELLAVLGDRVAYRDGRAVVVRDASGTEQRLSRLPPDASLPASEALVLVSEQGVVSVFDPSSGALRGRASIGAPSARLLYRPRTRVLVAPRALGGHDVLVRVDASGALEARSLGTFDPPAPPRRILGRLLVNQRPVAGVLVRVGDARVRTRADGRFSARVALEGPLAVHVDRDELVRRTHRPCANELEEVVEPPLDPRAPVRVVLGAWAGDYECDRVCRCD